MSADKIDPNQFINGFKVTVGWLLNSLRKNDKTFIHSHGNRAVKGVTAKDVSEGKGFASEILRCTVSFVDSIDASDVYTTILKIPVLRANRIDNESPLSGYGIEASESLRKAHIFECDFYSSLAPLLSIPLPTAHFVIRDSSDSQASCIHMEDLTLKGKTLSYFDSVNLTQVKNFIRVLAKMHKNILTADPKQWQKKFFFNEGSMKAVLGMLEPMIPPFLKMSKREEAFKPFLEKYQKFITNTDYYIYAYTKAYKDLDLSPVLVHGDMHSGNVMWATNKDGDIETNIAAIVDWQTPYEGSPMADLARFLVMAADGVVRRQAEEFAIDFYYECLIKEFEGDARKVPYTAEKLQKAYNLAFLTQVFFMTGMVVFLYDSLDKQQPNKAIKNAFVDAAVLKALHGIEDLDRLLQGEMKEEIYEKYCI
uniref:CHK kinase-like domain-containing protein n=1 Tax=Panagrolaimus davidi TaxID=227884 RepID=A0A914QSY1_9BILA